jgi:flotillin
MDKKDLSGKRWGYFYAKPSEYLIKIRKGKVVRHGPGLSVFLWPGDSCTILPTSIQRIAFVADQITAEKVGVAVTGIAVYRIADPLLAFRMLDFSLMGTGIEHLSSILRDMFIGAARRLVANMTVEECLTRRKENIAQELMREIQPVLSGQGCPEDQTHKGWGVLLDTIEIQDVRILSEKVFADLQSPYRARLELASRRSQVQRDEELHLSESEAQRSMLEADLELSRRRSEAEEHRRLEELNREERLRLAEIGGQTQVAEKQLELDLATRERSRKLADSEHQLQKREAEHRAALAEQQALGEAHLALQKAAQQIDMEKRMTEARLDREEMESTCVDQLARRRLEVEQLQGELKNLLAKQTKEVENLLPEARLRHDLLIHSLPAIAEAFALCMGPVHLTQINSGGGQNGGVHFFTELVAQILAVSQSAGFDLRAILPSAAPQGNPEADE